MTSNRRRKRFVEPSSRPSRPARGPGAVSRSRTPGASAISVLARAATAPAMGGVPPPVDRPGARRWWPRSPRTDTSARSAGAPS